MQTEKIKNEKRQLLELKKYLRQVRAKNQHLLEANKAYKEQSIILSKLLISSEKKNRELMEINQALRKEIYGS